MLGIVPALAQTNSVERIGTFQLKDQHGVERRYEFPRTNVTLVVVADHKGSEQLESWIRPIFRRYGGRVAIEGIADVSNVPAGLRGMVQRAFVKKLDYSVMLDWRGDVARQFKPGRNVANVFVLSRHGNIALRTNGGADERKLHQVFGAVDALLAEK